MSALVPIGEFSRLTHLTVKTLRHYHEIGLFEPESVDPGTGYRRYTTNQVSVALLIGRLRNLSMPLPEVRQVLRSRTDEERNAVIAAHLDRMEAELTKTRSIVSSLRSFLINPHAGIQVGYRTIDPVPALSVSAVVPRLDIDTWCESAFSELYGRLASTRLVPSGPAGATYSDEFFTEDTGTVTAYLPVINTHPHPDLTDIAGASYAITLHTGPFTDFDRTYAALGSHVAENDTVAPGPIREIYLVAPGDVDDPAGYRTEVCWPVSA